MNTHTYICVCVRACVRACVCGASLLAQMVKNLPTMQETQVRRSPGEREWLPIPAFLPREFQGQRSLVGYSSWGCKDSDMTE